MGIIYILGTVIFTVYGQLVLKWRISLHESMPEAFLPKVLFLTKLLLDPYVLSGFAAAFIASFFWMAALSKLQLSYAYPFMSMAFVLVLVLSGLLFNEPVSWQKVAGMILIVCGIAISSFG